MISNYVTMCTYTIIKYLQLVISLISFVSMVYVILNIDQQCVITNYFLPVEIYAYLSLILTLLLAILSMYLSKHYIIFIANNNNQKCLFWIQIIGRLCLILISFFVIFGFTFQCDSIQILLSIDCINQIVTIPIIWYTFNVFMQYYDQDYNDICCC